MRCTGSIDDSLEYYSVSRELNTSEPVYVHRKCFECMKCTTPLNLKTAKFPKNSRLILCERDYKDYEPKSPKEKCFRRKVVSRSRNRPSETVKEDTTPVIEPVPSDSSDDVKPINLQLQPEVSPVPTSDPATNESEPPVPLLTEVKQEPLSPEELAPSGTKVDTPSFTLPIIPSNPAVTNQPLASSRSMPALLNVRSSTQPVSNRPLNPSLSLPNLESSFTILPVTSNLTGAKTTSGQLEKLPVKEAPLNNNVLPTDEAQQQQETLAFPQVKEEPIASEELIDVEGLEPEDNDELAKRPRKRKPTKTGKFRAFLTEKHKLVLGQAWLKGMFPSKEEREKIGQELGLDQRQVQIWFQNQRRMFQSLRGRDRKLAAFE